MQTRTETPADALRADDYWIPELSLAPVSVAPGHQGTGIGTALVRVALDTARNRGEHTVTALGHPAYYPRFGFERADTNGVTCTLTSGPDGAKLVLSLDGSPIPPGEMGFGKPLADAVSAYRPE
ncbi:GNAT family N-acetyltransferase [Streptomyces sp. NPDC050658]|uniref:GNAT family N-acetyltransferase n=1 Tax=unclassified Streptomyces TaxID=2593676 RepID=UPI00343B9CA0